MRKIFGISGILVTILLAGCALPSPHSGTCATSIMGGTLTYPCGTNPFSYTVKPYGGSNGGVAVGHTSGRFTVTANLAIGSAGHTATLLPDGSVLVAGAGQLDIDDLLISFNSTQILSPSGQVSSSGSLTTPREFHTATLLPNGKVLIAGGDAFFGYPNGLSPTITAELYDPAAGKSTRISDMSTFRTGHTASLLADGRVLIFGGAVTGLPSAEVYDPVAGGFTELPSPELSRSGHTATVLPSGKVLIVGGRDASQTFASAEIFDPATNSFRAVGSMAEPRVHHTATLLPNGKVLITGGGVASTSGFGADLSIAPQQVVIAPSNTAEIFDPQTEKFTSAGTMFAARSSHTATLLPDGTVLLCGGSSPWYTYVFGTFYTGYLGDSSAEIYDPSTGSSRSIGLMNAGKFWHTATLLPDGSVVLIGGIGQDLPLNVVETFK